MIGALLRTGAFRPLIASRGSSGAGRLAGARSASSAAASDRRERESESERGLGLLAPLAVLSSIGVLLIALADRASREGSPRAQVLFWAGVAMLAAPAAARLAGAGASRAERLGVSLLTGLGFYLAKVAYDPARLSFSDESIHLRSVGDDLYSGRLFSFNPLLPEASHYPGLGGITTGLVRLTGLPISTAGMLVIGSARLVLMLAIFLLAERLTASARVAGLACLLYCANPNFLYWSAQFSYESLALPLVAFTLYLLVRRTEPAAPRGLAVLAGAAVLAVVVTHHLSSYFLAVVLFAWSAAILFRRHRLGAAGEYSPAPLALLAATAIAVWLGNFAPVTGQYLGSIAASTSTGLFNVITGASATRKLFASGAQVAPAWERMLGMGAVALTVLGLAVAAWLVWRRRRAAPLLLVPLALALLYPLLLPLRFIGSAAETANRSTEFLYLGVGTALAIAVVDLARRAHRWRPAAGVALTALCTAVVCGGVAVSWQYSERLPQDQQKSAVPYQLGAPALSADLFARRRLGRGHRFASDFLDHLGLATYGAQRTLWAPVDHVSAWEVMAPASFDQDARRAIRVGRIEYALLDDRLVYGLPASGFYFDKGEPLSLQSPRRPLGRRSLDKFAATPGVARVYDNGRQQIYALGGLR